VYFRFSSQFFFLLLYSFSCLAENSLPEVIVTATRSAQTVDDALASVTVITREDIDNSQALTLPEVLRGVPGLDISTTGGFGKQTSVFMRGTESDHVLVLVDGVKVGSATAGITAFEHLPLSQIERIEIVRGPRSSLYGSEAIGGVIQIFTRQGKGKKPQVELSAGMGEDRTYEFTAGVSGSTKENWYSLYANRLKTDGFNACEGNTSGGCFTVEPDADGYKNTSYGISLGHRFENNLTVETHAMQATANNQYDSSGANKSDVVQRVIGLKTDYLINQSWQMSLNLGRSRDELENFGHNTTPSFFNTKRTTASFQTNFLYSDANSLIIGYDYLLDEVDSSTNFAEKSRNNHGVFLESQSQFGKTDLILGLRQDDNEQFGRHSTGNIALGYAVSPQTRVFISYATAFKAPNFNDLYWPDSAFFGGNPNLNPEKSESIEIGLKGKQADYRWSLNAYRTKIDQMISFQTDPVTFKGTMVNIDKAKIKGIDGALNWRKAGFEFNLTGSWLKPEDDTTGKLLARRAEKTLNVEIAERKGAGRLGISWLMQSHRYDDSANKQRLSGYGILNLTADYYFNKNWVIRTRLENVLDKEYETVRFYNTQRRFWFVSLHYLH
jgi:vitamin B12 transporter